MGFAITEADAGSNTHRITTRVRADVAGWRLAGTKIWTTDVDQSEALLVVARHEGLGERRDPLSLLIVPTATPGVSCRPIPTALAAPERQFMTYFERIKSRRSDK